MTVRLLRALIRSLAVIVPKQDRARWREEWAAEIEQVGVAHGRSAAARVALGAVPDAFALRRLAAARRDSGSSTSHVLRRISWMDFKLGARMLVKYPGLTVVGGLAMASAVGIGAASFEAVTQLVSPTLPLEEGHRIVAIRNWDIAANREEPRTLHDFGRWRDELGAVIEVGAFRIIERNLITSDGAAEPIEVAEISASGFRIARVRPMLGRVFTESEEQVASPPVVVIGYQTWQNRFGGDPAVVGRIVRVGGVNSTVVGVMPAGFAFPIAQSFWMPLQLNPLEHLPREGPAIRVFGRLAPGVTMEEAQAAMAIAASHSAVSSPRTHGTLRTDVLPYARSVVDVSDVSIGLSAFNLSVIMFLVLVCSNVAALVFARAVLRRNEIVVRTALGASRGRIVFQLFAESLVLGAVAALAGIAGGVFGLRWWYRVAEAEAGGRLPFWLEPSLSPTTILYVCALTVLGALIAGGVPALKVTGRRVDSRLRQAAAGGSDLRLGGIWTVVIVAQVAVTVAFPGAAFFVQRYVAGFRSLDAGFPVGEFLSARFEMDGESSSGTPLDASGSRFQERFQATYQELERRLATEAQVLGVTFAEQLPRTLHPRRRVEVEGDERVSSESESSYLVNVTSIAVGYFDVVGAPVLAGRDFSQRDPGSTSRPVVVNRSFVRDVLGGRNAIGRRVRYLIVERDETGRAQTQGGPWHEVVGVVRDLGMVNDDPRAGSGLYHPAAPRMASPLHLMLHVKGEPESFAPRLRAIAASVDASLRLHEVLPLDRVGSTLWMEFAFLFRLFLFVSAVAMLLALAGIYSIMSFTVSRRTREIGIRVALGSDARHIVMAIFSRSLAQVGFGVVLGGALVSALTQVVDGFSPKEVGVVLAYMALMMGVCMLACVVPTRRALRVEPTEALRVEA